MIENILGSIQSQIQNSLDGENLPNGISAHEVADEAGKSIFSKLSSGINNGDLSGIQEMFSGADTNPDSEVIQSISPDLVTNLSNKFGFNANQAQGIISKILPSVMNMYNKNAASGNFDLQSIIGQFKNNNIGEIVENIFNQNDSNNNAQRASGGGILGILKGLFGK